MNDANKTESRTVTILQAAQMLHLHPTTVRNRLLQGKFPGTKMELVNGLPTYLIPVDAVRAYDKARKRQS